MTIIKKSEFLSEIEITYKTKVKPSNRKQITRSEDTYEVLKEIWDQQKIEHVEQFVVLLLNRANRVLGCALVSTGGISATVVDQRVIFQLAINANASSIILSHNHPSGQLKPSNEDLKLTREIKTGGDILGIRTLDHVIITSEGYTSFADEGLI